jgi:hypothetical protein
MALGFGIRPSFKGRFLSPRAEPNAAIRIAVGPSNVAPPRGEAMLRWLDDVGVGELLLTLTHQAGRLLAWLARQAAEAAATCTGVAVALLRKTLRHLLSFARELFWQCVALLVRSLRHAATALGELVWRCEAMVTGGVRLVHMYGALYLQQLLDYTGAFEGQTDTLLCEPQAALLASDAQLWSDDSSLRQSLLVGAAGLGASKELRLRVLAALIVAVGLWRGLSHLDAAAVLLRYGDENVANREIRGWHGATEIGP